MRLAEAPEIADVEVPRDPLGSPAPRTWPPALVTLSPDDLRHTYEQTLIEPRRTYGPISRALFKIMDAVYGTERTLPKFKVLEVIARVPYQAWEHVGYVAITHQYSRPPFARRVFERVEESRRQQDNEQWHLLILEELIWEEGVRESFVRYRVMPQIVAFIYHRISWLLYVMRPAWSYALNADFEDHAQHEYALYVSEHPELDAKPHRSHFAAEYGEFESVADLLRQISYDEMVHKEESLARITEARFE